MTLLCTAQILALNDEVIGIDNVELMNENNLTVFNGAAAKIDGRNVDVV